MNYRVMEQLFRYGEVEITPILSRVGHQEAILHAEALNKSHQAKPTSGVRVYYIELMTRGER